MYEEQLKKIIMVQTCVRRWLARIRFKREKWQLAVSVVTLQRHIRGWLVRKHAEEEAAKKRSEDEANALEEARGKRQINPLPTITGWTRVCSSSLSLLKIQTVIND